VSKTPPSETLTSKGTHTALPPALDELARMAEAHVGQRTMKAFIANSPVVYSLSADQIIALKERGVPDNIIAAAVEHGAKLRARPASPKRAHVGAVRHWRHYPWTNPPLGYAPGYGAWQPMYPPGYLPYPRPMFPPYQGYSIPYWGPLFSFNNSYPTYINDYPVYSGYYVPGYGYLP